MAKTEDQALPQTKAEAQRVCKGFGYTGLKIDGIDLLDNEARIYAWTSKQLQADNTWKRRACTVVVLIKEDTVAAEKLDGWVVDAGNESPNTDRAEAKAPAR